MESVVLITLRSGSRARTFVFDCQRQSLLWVGMGDDLDTQTAVACVELTGDGLLLRAMGSAMLLVPGQDREMEGPVLIAGDSSLMLGIVEHATHNRMSLFVRPYARETISYSCLTFGEGADLTIGRSDSCTLCYRCVYVSTHHAHISYESERFYVRDQRSGNATIVNGEVLPAYQRRLLKPGDVVQILDLWLVVGKGFLLVVAPREAYLGENAGIRRRALDEAPCARVASALEREHTAFHPAPWLSESLIVPTVVVEPPPEQAQEETRPLIMQLGPSLLMGLSAVYLGGNVVSGILRGVDALTLVPSICMAVAMLGTTVVWPVVAHFYEKRCQRARRMASKELYVSYLDRVERDLQALATRQRSVLLNSYRCVDELLVRARERSPLLMSHVAQGDGFLCLRVGLGDVDLGVEVQWPQRRLSLAEEPLWDALEQLKSNQPTLHDVPLFLDLKQHHAVGVVGDERFACELIRGLLIQLCALYSYADVRIAIVCDERTKSGYDAFFFVPHIQEPQDEQRLVAMSVDGARRTDALLKQLHTSDGMYVVVVCTNAELFRHMPWLQHVCAHTSYDRVSCVFVGSQLHDLPRECDYLIDLAEEGTSTSNMAARMFARTAVEQTTARFVPDALVTSEQSREFALSLARIDMTAAAGAMARQGSLGFLELYEVGRVTHLDVVQRWTHNEAARSLRVPVGMDDKGELAYIDLHERADGPHGLVAGTTGSGKSEFIITLVLSLCVNFSPSEVAFLLIDYKGGGLAGAFENVRVRLPHLAGSITNLDGSFMHRALVSLRSELVRRQELLSAAKDLTGDATMDIYRYLALYRQGILVEPMPHLFVIADEFAELKQQEPAFMEELMSAARIGRSLGVHLLLATQKPTGVINDQIWANARLKVSLKVSDAADSREMIRRDDAARLRRPGSFLALVGYDDRFWEGQAAYAGMPYVPKDCFEAARDDAVSLVDGEGQVVTSMRPAVARENSGESELNAVLSYVAHTAESRGALARPLWLAPLDEHISLFGLETTYPQACKGSMTCLVGELDDPARQARHPLCVDLERVGCVVLYGTHGSDVEGLMRAMIVSLVREHTSDELWIYGVDASDGGLRALEEAPCVGGIVSADDEQRLFQLLRLLENAVQARRLGADPNRSLPPIVVAFANLPACIGLYPVLEERLQGLMRDAARFDVYVLATADGPGSLHVRMRNCFLQALPTMLADSSDYAFVLGSPCGLSVSSRWRHGVALYEGDALEFQGVLVGEEPEDEDEAVAAWATSLRESGQACAPAIPTLPERVAYQQFVGMDLNGRLPVGIDVHELAPVFLEGGGCSSVLVTGNDAHALVGYVRGAMQTWSRVSGKSVIVLDVRASLGVFGSVPTWRETSNPTGEESVSVLRQTSLRSETARGIHPLLPLDSTSLSGQESMQVLTSVDGVNEFLVQADSEGLAREMIVVMDAPYLVDVISAEARRAFETIACEGTGAVSLLVLVGEYWRFGALYDDWYRRVSLQGKGLWIGAGFADQTVFHLPRIESLYRRRAGTHDGFVVDAGSVRSVVLLEEVGNEGEGQTAHTDAAVV